MLNISGRFLHYQVEDEDHNVLVLWENDYDFPDKSTDHRKKMEMIRNIVAQSRGLSSGSKIGLSYFLTGLFEYDNVQKAFLLDGHLLYENGSMLDYRNGLAEKTAVRARIDAESLAVQDILKARFRHLVDPIGRYLSSTRFPFQASELSEAKNQKT